MRTLILWGKHPSHGTQWIKLANNASQAEMDSRSRQGFQLVRLANGEHPDQLGPLPLEHIAEYDSAAEWCAKRGLKGVNGDPLPDNMGSPGAIDWIQADPESFERRVRECAYGLAMSR